MTTYLAKHLFDGTKMHKNVHLQVDHGQIIALLPASTSPLNADQTLEGLVCAGFIDTQVNGGGGVLFNHAPTIDSLQKMIVGHAQYGTTSMLPTLITDSHETMLRAADAVQEAMQVTDARQFSGHSFEQNAMAGIAGIHFEGPHLSIEKKGIHPGSHVRPISDADLALFTRKDIGRVMLTIAPENVPADIIRELTAHGVVVSLGHSNAMLSVVERAIEAGAKCFTHLFNAMSGLTARNPGMIASALTQASMYSGLIADLHHVHPLNCRLAYQCIGAERLMLVTDAMAHVGSDMRDLPWLDDTIRKQGNRLSLADGSLAGSCLDMAGAVKNMFKVISQDLIEDEPNDMLGNVLNMASKVPASMMLLQDRGTLTTGKRADFVLLDDDLNTQACWISGEQVSGIIF